MDKEIVVYSKPNCPGCTQVKDRLTREGKEWREVVLGEDLSVDEFFKLYPEVRSVPFVVYPD